MTHEDKSIVAMRQKKKAHKIDVENFKDLECITWSVRSGKNEPNHAADLATILVNKGDEV